MASNPKDYPTVTPALNVDGAAKAIELYKKAFGATEDYRMEDEKGKIMHAALTIGTSKLFLADATMDSGCGTPSKSSFYLYMDDVDTAFKKARDAGLSETWPLTDMFWGDRTGTVTDAFGITWTLATHVKDVSPEDMEKGRKEFMKQMSSKVAA